MTISDKSRKILWARSGNRCAICKQELIFQDSNTNNKAVVGDECHIISGQANGPRYSNNYSKASIDDYENLILLCKVHHKVIDDLHETYTVEILNKIKESHEKWVAEKLNKKEIDEIQPIKLKRFKENIPEHLLRIETGKQLYNIIRDAESFSFDYEEFDSSEEAEMIACFLQSIQDYAGISSISDEIGEKINTECELSNIIKEIEKSGFWLFGACEKQQLVGGNQPSQCWNMAILHILKKNHSSIVKIKV